MGGEGDTGPVKLSRPAAAGGIAGPVLFTVAWVVSSLRQAGHSAVEVQLSGLAAEDARDPQIMMAGFVPLGAGTVVFGAGLGRVTAPRSACPWLVLVAGAASIAAGLFRRDHMLLAGRVSPVNRGTTRCTMSSAESRTGRCSRHHWRWRGAGMMIRTGRTSAARFKLSRWPAPRPWRSSRPGLPGRTTAWCSGSRSRCR